jgi:hypothetical protein
MKASWSLKLCFFNYWCTQFYWGTFGFSLRDSHPLFKEVFQFYLNCNHVWPTACSKFLISWSQVLLPKLKLWSSILHHPVCLPVSHIPTCFESSHSFTRTLISKLSPASFPSFLSFQQPSFRKNTSILSPGLTSSSSSSLFPLLFFFSQNIVSEVLMPSSPHLDLKCFWGHTFFFESKLMLQHPSCHD